MKSFYKIKNIILAVLLLLCGFSNAKSVIINHSNTISKLYDPSSHRKTLNAIDDSAFYFFYTNGDRFSVKSPISLNNSWSKRGVLYFKKFDINGNLLTEKEYSPGSYLEDYSVLFSKRIPNKDYILAFFEYGTDCECASSFDMLFCDCASNYLLALFDLNGNILSSTAGQQIQPYTNKFVFSFLGDTVLIKSFSLDNNIININIKKYLVPTLQFLNESNTTFNLTDIGILSDSYAYSSKIEINEIYSKNNTSSLKITRVLTVEDSITDYNLYMHFDNNNVLVNYQINPYEFYQKYYIDNQSFFLLTRPYYSNDIYKIKVLNSQRQLIYSDNLPANFVYSIIKNPNTNDINIYYRRNQNNIYVLQYKTTTNSLEELNYFTLNHVFSAEDRYNTFGNIGYFNNDFGIDKYVFGAAYFIPKNSSGATPDKIGVILVDSSGYVLAKNQGNIFADQNGNCIKDTQEIGLPNWTVIAYNETDTFYCNSNEDGSFILYTDTGQYTFKLIHNEAFPYWSNNPCSPERIENVNTNGVNDLLFGVTPTIQDCPNLQVNISSPFLRRCFNSTYTVSYANNGTLSVENAHIQVQLDQYLSILSSEIPFVDLGNNLYQFNIETIPILTTNQFDITVYVDCDSTVLGQTHCTEAHIYPDTVCSEPIYNGALIVTNAICKDSVINFKIINEGGDMSTPKNYRVVEDQVMIIDLPFQLPRGNQINFDVPTKNGSFYMLTAEQEDNFPNELGDLYATSFVEGCTNQDTTPIVINFTTAYPLFDGEPYLDIDCQQNIGSYDPNDKSASPIGVDTLHYIPKDIFIDYKIRFQNIGTDTAFTVVVIDTISTYLDITTIKNVFSSHHFIYERIDDNVIKFIFNNINLVDSSTNETKSHGFVQFKIKQKPNNPIGTKILNRASIKFDFNTPILTNQTFHTVGENYIEVRLLSKVIQSSNLYDIKVFPNPTTDFINIQLLTNEQINGNIVVYDIYGKIHKKLPINNNNISFNVNELSKGVYIIQITEDSKILGIAKILIK